MATIRVRDWTKEQIEKIQDAESHSSHDSVIKSLLKDRQLARFADSAGAQDTPPQQSSHASPPDKAYDNLTVLDELVEPESGVLFLWCPNCGNEIVHLTVENALGISVFEVDCQRCLNTLDQHSIVSIEIGYPIEQKIIDGDLQADLKRCVIDYWDRTLSQLPERDVDDETEIEHLIWKIGSYVQNFMWDWPTDTPAVGIETGYVYRDTAVDECIEVLEPVTNNRNAPDSYKVKRYGPDEDPAGVTPEILDSDTIVDLLISRQLVIEATDPADEREQADELH